MGKALIIKGADFSGGIPTPKSYTLTLAVSPTGGGNVTGAGTYVQGTEVQIKASANSGYSFVSWSDGNTNAIRTITVDSNISLTALFADATIVTLVLNGNENWEANPASSPNPNKYGYYNIYFVTSISPKLSTNVDRGGSHGFAQATCSDSYFNRLGELDMQDSESPCFNYYSGTKTIFFRFPSSKMSQDVNTWKNYLKNNPITITYKKA